MRDTRGNALPRATRAPKVTAAIVRGSSSVNYEIHNALFDEEWHYSSCKSCYDIRNKPA